MPQKDTSRSPVVSFRIGWKAIDKLKQAGLIGEDYDTPDLNSVVKQTFFDALENNSAKAAIDTDFLQDLSSGVEELRNTSYQLMLFRLAEHCKNCDRHDYVITHQSVQAIEIILDSHRQDIKNGDSLPSLAKDKLKAFGEQLNTCGGFDLMAVVCDLMSAKCTSYGSRLNKLWDGIGEWAA